MIFPFEETVENEFEIGTFKLESSTSLFGLSSNLTLLFNKEDEVVITWFLEFEENEGLSSILSVFKFDELNWDYEL